MSEFNDFMDKAGAFASKAMGTAKDLAAMAVVKTRQVSRVTKLNMDISAQRETIRKAYTELGKLYYEAHHDAPEGQLAQACQEIDMAMAAITAMEEEISLLKEAMAEPEEPQDADFEAVVTETEAAADVEVEIEVEEPETPAEPEAPEAPETPAQPEQPEAFDEEPFETPVESPEQFFQD